MQPHQVLYHGTSLSAYSSISTQGLVGKLNNVVYLTADITYAYQYACKHNSAPVICIVDAVQMYKDGFQFDANLELNEWTCETVPFKYVTAIQIETETDLNHVVEYSKQLDCLHR